MLFSEVCARNGYNSTENALWTDKQRDHGYNTGFYDEIVVKWLDKAPDVLEIGVFNGGSLAAWHDYFTDGRIIGIDICPRDAVENCKGMDRVRIIVGDAYSEKFAESLGQMFDFIVDDGPHSPESQAAAVRIYAPLLKPGGALVVEDVATDYAMRLMAAQVPPGMKFYEVDCRASAPAPDSRLFVVENPIDAE